MEAKKTNLCLSADVTTSAQLLALADQTGPFICMLKTHCDIIGDWTAETARALKALAQQHNFVIFEDRKFADIGSTVVQQFTGGLYAIASWADCVNAHILPGPAIIDAFKAPFAASASGQGLILLAEMSSKGNLLTASYAADALAWAKQSPETVFGSCVCDAVVRFIIPFNRFYRPAQAPGRAARRVHLHDPWGEPLVHGRRPGPAVQHASRGCRHEPHGHHHRWPRDHTVCPLWWLAGCSACAGRRIPWRWPVSTSRLPGPRTLRASHEIKFRKILLHSHKSLHMCFLFFVSELPSRSSAACVICHSYYTVILLADPRLALADNPASVLSNLRTASPFILPELCSTLA